MQSATNLLLIKPYAELRYIYTVYYLANIHNNNIRIQPPIKINFVYPKGPLLSSQEINTINLNNPKLYLVQFRSRRNIPM